VYVLTPHGLTKKAELTGRFLKRKMAEYEMLKHEIESLKIQLASQEMKSDVVTEKVIS
jgi:hypothetical protein